MDQTPGNPIELQSNHTDKLCHMSNRPTKYMIVPNDLPLTSKKNIIINALKKDGYNNSDIGRLLGLHRQSVLTHTKKPMVSLAPLAGLAKRAIKQTLKGIAIGEADQPKASDIMTASKMVMDRVQPIINQVESKSVNISMSLSDERYDRYKKLLNVDIAQLIGNNDADDKIAQIEHVDNIDKSLINKGNVEK